MVTEKKLSDDAENDTAITSVGHNKVHTKLISTWL